MPQASDELRARIAKAFEEETGGEKIVDPDIVFDHLKERGFTMKDFNIQAPPVWELPTQLDFDCIDYLIDEWDYGYVNSRGVKNG